ncbi:MAG: hypothetical protein AAFU79_25605 [Myxococcota bacterium]
MQYRHGDVMLEKLLRPPGGEKRLLPHRVLAHGEVTGHRHQIQEPQGSMLYEMPAYLLLEVTADFVTLVHEEHKPIELERGYYKVWRQREYSPEEIRVIRD